MCHAALVSYCKQNVNNWVIHENFCTQFGLKTRVSVQPEGEKCYQIQSTTGRWMALFIAIMCTAHTSQVYVQLNSTMRLISGTLRSTPLPWLPVLSNIELPPYDKLMKKIVKHDRRPIQPGILSPPLLRLTSSKPLWLDLQPVDIKSRWRHNWKSAQVVNSHLVLTPQSGNRVSTSLGNSGLCWTVFARNRDTAVPAEGYGNLYWSVSLWRDPDNVSHYRILTPDKTEWQLISATLCRFLKL